ncbi:ribonuclease HI [Rivularia sp. PCC 7116]|uniref:ribonuclease HI n=1 Tax=Rivularia sp. PCC 7116 TaxID=373994 RepID=UPI00029ED59F|nr:ribonuclease HI [Rivularia sp. PCC 7116]AFY56953.1 ribonuclease HI [Rivularia sp. PCC 7116]
MSSQPTIQNIYTDGACTGNPGPGGWGVVVYFDDGSIHEIGDASKKTTNNRMEMQAAIAALEFLESSGQNKPVTLYTDSEYLINCVTKWVKGWKRKGWKKSDGKPVLNQDLLEILDNLNNQKIKWQHVRGHAGNIGNERCDTIARGFASGKIPSLKQMLDINFSDANFAQKAEVEVSSTSNSHITPPVINKKIHNSNLESDTNNTKTMESSSASATLQNEDLPRETRVSQLRSLVETLRIADEIAEKGYLITSSELADLMNVHASAVTSRGDQWRWRNWIVSRVRREGNQILWELERADKLDDDEGE